MANVERDHIDIDTNPYPTMPASLYGTATDVLLGTGTSGPSHSDIESGESSRAEPLSVDIPMTTYPTVEATSQRMQSSIPHQSTSAIMSGETPPPPKLSIGVIFAIVVGSFIGLAIPIILLTQYLKRSQQRTIQAKEEDAILRHMISHQELDEKARNVGFERLHRDSTRKWSEKGTTAQLVHELDQVDPGVKTLRAQGCEEREMLKKPFEPGEKAREMDREKELPAKPKI